MQNDTLIASQTSLDGLRSGETATIHWIAAEQATAKRLADLGFVRGAKVTVLRTGTPCLVRIGQTCVGLGRALQRCIRLSPLTKPS